MSVKNENAMERYMEVSVPKAALANIIPAVGALVLALIYNMTDTFFIGQTQNDLLVASVSLTMPLGSIFVAFGTIFGVGGLVAIGNALGAGDKKKANRLAAFSFWNSLFIGIVFALLCFFLKEPFAHLLGATENTFTPACTYLGIYAFLCPTTCASTVGNALMRVEGHPVAAMMGQVIGNAVNIILDPILILQMDMGIAGAAYATVIGGLVSLAWYVIFYLTGKSQLKIGLKNYTWKGGLAKEVIPIGTAAALVSIAMSISGIISNLLLGNYSDLAIAGYGVAGRLYSIVLLVVMGIGNGMQALFSYCIGADNAGKLKSFIRFSLMFSTVVGTVISALCICFAKPLTDVFLTEQQSSDYAVGFLRILLITGCLLGAFYVINSLIQSYGDFRGSLLLSLSRNGFLLIPLMLLLCMPFAEYGVSWAQPAADVIAFILAILLIRRKPGRILSAKKTGSEPLQKEENKQ